ncbi:hypothetical protein Scep_029031 [Stephania cephalantha]|uniref:RRM domain-containing protein n=1 Tax=Stephania cephalantha TaxID=152367 RepID=A0AAP0EJG3_9MAGN
MFGRGGGGRDRDRDRVDRGDRGDRFRIGPRDYEDKSGSGDRSSSSYGRSNAPPPSRHLWVGNLSHHLSESALSEHFLRFGELESVAFQPGRSYAFVNYKKQEDAIIAMGALQALNLSGLPIRIEFQKADKSIASNDQHLPRRDETRSSERKTSLFQRDTRARTSSHEPFYPEKSKMGDKNAEPSEVLWIGFPTFLNVNEALLRRAFSPFGEIEKITVFPGRSYAFVQFRNLVAACRAKEVLQGKLFDNPRVSICFARSEVGSSEHGRNSTNGPFSPNSRTFNNLGREDSNLGDLTNDSRLRSPKFSSNLDFSSVTGFSGKGSFWAGGSGSFDLMRLQGPRSELGPSEDVYENRSSPVRDRGPQFQNFSPGAPAMRGSLYDDPPEFSENAFLFREAKKLKTGTFPPDKKLIERPFYESGLEKQQACPPPTLLDLPGRDTFDKKFSSGAFSHNWRLDPPINLVHPHGEREDHWQAPSNRSELGSGPLPTNPSRWHASPQKSHQSPLNDEWKWEGTIARGGTPVCHARCFPVGKVMDMILPEFLDCTARTGLDMLAKHFYQAASSWVVFFVPASDADIAFYNEFMHFLGEKQRAAVAKLGERTTLFLVPPSEFSEKVLKVPGKMSISGVILRFQEPTNDFGSINHPLGAVDSKLASFREDMSQHLKATPPDMRTSSWSRNQSVVNSFSHHFPPLSSFPTLRKPGPDAAPHLGNVPGVSPSSTSSSLAGSIHLTRGFESLGESRYIQPHQPANPVLPSNFSPHHLQGLNPVSGNFLPQLPDNAAMRSSDNIIPKEALFGKPTVMHEASSNLYDPGMIDIPWSGSTKFGQQQEMKPQSYVSPPVPSFEPEQLAQLASVLGKRQAGGSAPILSGQEEMSMANRPERTFVAVQKSMSLNYARSDPSASQLTQVQPLLQQTSNPLVVPQMGSRESQSVGSGSEGNVAVENIGSRGEDTDADPQKRLQATLQLAATLLQQIQQQAKGV